jgi:transcription elongation factor GreB
MEVRYRIVGADEFDPRRNWISVDSPMARALLTRSVDERITLELPDGRMQYDILQVAYQEDGD